jgi:hypothetical protein
MIYKNNFTLPSEYLEELAKQGLDGLSDLVRILVNDAMRIERENFLRAKTYERTEERRGYANGFAKHAFGETQDRQNQIG